MIQNHHSVSLDPASQVLQALFVAQCKWASEVDPPSSFFKEELADFRVCFSKQIGDVLSSCETKPSSKEGKTRSMVPSHSEKEVRKEPIEASSKIKKVPKRRAKESLTSFWVRSQGSQLRKKLVAYLQRKLPKSQSMCKIEDHVQTFLANMIDRGSLDERIARGEKIYTSQVCVWCRRSAYSDLRKESRNPVTRTLHGTMTRDERDTLEKVNWTEQVVLNPSERRATTKDEDGRLVSMDLLPSEDGSIDVVENEQAFRYVMGRVEKAIEIALKHRKDTEIHKAILIDKFIKNYTVPEISVRHNLPIKQVNANIQRIRKAVRRANDRGAFSI